MRKRYWVASCVGLCGLWSCASDSSSSDTDSPMGTESEQTSTTASDGDTTEPGTTNTSGQSGGTGSDGTQGSDQTSTSGNASDQTDNASGSGETDGTTTDTSGASGDDSSDVDSSDATTDDANSSPDTDTSTGNASDETNTSEGTTDETSDIPVNPGDQTSDSSARLKTVPIGTSDAELGYWEYLPPNYADGPSPLLVFTHGASWQGDGSEEQLQKLLTVGPVNLMSEDKWPNSRPFVVLAPQNPHSGCFTADDIDGFYHYALGAYDIDTTRIYHTGQSCGAIGGWNYLAAHLDEFVTAAVLISGDGQDAFEQAGCDLGRVAIWGLHNEKDGTVNSAGTINPIMDLMMCDPVPDVKLTIYPDATEHDAWTKTYDLSAGNDIYSWLLEHTHQ